MKGHRGQLIIIYLCFDDFIMCVLNGGTVAVCAIIVFINARVADLTFAENNGRLTYWHLSMASAGVRLHIVIGS